jgi:hypothetical protein
MIKLLRLSRCIGTMAALLALTLFFIQILIFPITHPPGLGVAGLWVFGLIPISAALFARMENPRGMLLFLYGIIGGSFQSPIFFSDRDFRFSIASFGVPDSVISPSMFIFLIAIGAACWGAGIAALGVNRGGLGRHHGDN